jgi:hypothetical protein
VTLIADNIKQTLIELADSSIKIPKIGTGLEKTCAAGMARNGSLRSNEEDSPALSGENHH